MQANEETYQLLFQTFGDVRPCWPLILLAICLCSISLIGIFLNSTVIYVTAKSKSLRSSTNFLLALTCFFELLHQHGHFLFLFVALSGTNFIDFRLAVRLSSLALFGTFGIAPLMLFTGLDRLLCVTMPIFYNKMPQGPYLGAITAMCTGFCISLVAVQHWTSSQMPLLQVTGVLGDVLQGPGGFFYVKVSLSLNALTVFIYLLVWLIIRRQSSSSSVSVDQQRSRRLFRTLLTIISLNMGGYLLIFAYYAFFYSRMQGASIPAWFVEQFLGILVNISAASQGPVLCWTSTDYRTAFQTEFERLSKLCRRRRASVNPNHIKIHVIPVSKSASPNRSISPVYTVQPIQPK